MGSFDEEARKRHARRLKEVDETLEEAETAVDEEAKRAHRKHAAKKMKLAAAEYEAEVADEEARRHRRK